VVLMSLDPDVLAGADGLADSARWAPGGPCCPPGWL
jgi:hypothetical protein